MHYIFVGYFSVNIISFYNYIFDCHTEKATATTSHFMYTVYVCQEKNIVFSSTLLAITVDKLFGFLFKQKPYSYREGW